MLNKFFGRKPRILDDTAPTSELFAEMAGRNAVLRQPCSCKRCGFHGGWAPLSDSRRPEALMRLPGFQYVERLEGGHQYEASIGGHAGRGRLPVDALIRAAFRAGF